MPTRAILVMNPDLKHLIFSEKMPTISSPTNGAMVPAPPNQNAQNYYFGRTNFQEPPPQFQMKSMSGNQPALVTREHEFRPLNTLKKTL